MNKAATQAKIHISKLKAYVNQRFSLDIRQIFLETKHMNRKAVNFTSCD